jgi:hypothetical protein
MFSIECYKFAHLLYTNLIRKYMFVVLFASVDAALHCTSIEHYCMVFFFHVIHDAVRDSIVISFDISH